MKNKRAFTLMELMIVITVIGILSVVLVPKLTSAKNSTKSTGVKKNMEFVYGEVKKVIGDYHYGVKTSTSSSLKYSDNTDTRTAWNMADNLIYKLDGNVINPITNNNTVRTDGDNQNFNTTSSTITAGHSVVFVVTSTSIDTTISAIINDYTSTSFLTTNNLSNKLFGSVVVVLYPNDNDEDGNIDSNLDGIVDSREDDNDLRAVILGYDSNGNPLNSSTEGTRDYPLIVSK